MVNYLTSSSQYLEPKEYTLLVSGDATKIPRGLVDAGITPGSTLGRVPLYLIFVDNRLYAVRPSGKFGTLKVRDTLLVFVVAVCTQLSEARTK